MNNIDWKKLGYAILFTFILIIIVLAIIAGFIGLIWLLGQIKPWIAITILAVLGFAIVVIAVYYNL